jgi:hypothetical protein
MTKKANSVQQLTVVVGLTGAAMTPVYGKRFISWPRLLFPVANLNPTTTLITLSFRRKPESSYNDTKDGNFGSMDIGGLLDAGSSPA